jgi:hypothetical protein
MHKNIPYERTFRRSTLNLETSIFETVHFFDFVTGKQAKPEGGARNGSAHQD